MPATEGTVVRKDDALVFSGVIYRAAATSLWTCALEIFDGTQRIVLTEVTSVDSAGLALLAELAARMRACGHDPHLEGQPPGLLELCTAYRLTPGLDFPGATPTP